MHDTTFTYGTQAYKEKEKAVVVLMHSKLGMGMDTGRKEGQWWTGMSMSWWWWMRS